MTVPSFNNMTVALTESGLQMYNDSKHKNLSALLLRDFYCSAKTSGYIGG